MLPAVTGRQRRRDRRLRGAQAGAAPRRDARPPGRGARLEPAAVNVKFTTGEGMGFVGPRRGDRRARDRDAALVVPQDRGRPHRRVAAPLELGRGRVALEVDAHPPSSLLLLGQRRSSASIVSVANSSRTGRPGQGAKSSARMASPSAPLTTGTRPSGGMYSPRRSSSPRPRGGRRARVEELDRRRPADRERRLVERLDGREAVVGGPLEPGVGRDGRVVGGDPLCGARDVGRDLEGGDRGIGACPERSAAGRIAHRQRERQAAVGQRDRGQPVAQLRRARAGGGRDVREHLEGVAGAAGLALGGAQVGLEAPAVAAVGVAVAVDGGRARRPGRLPRASNSKRRRSSMRAWLAMNDEAAERFASMPGSVCHGPAAVLNLSAES